MHRRYPGMETRTHISPILTLSGKDLFVHTLAERKPGFAISKIPPVCRTQKNLENQV